MENNNIIDPFVKAIKEISKETNLPEEKITEITIQYLREEIKKQIKPQINQQEETEIKKQLKEKDKQIKDLQEEIKKQKEITNNIIEYTTKHKQEIIDLYEKKKVPSYMYKFLKEIEKINQNN